MRARYYDPQAGRFINEDIAKRGLNWFSYCDGDPVNMVDSDGHSPVSTVFWSIFAVVTIIGSGMSLAAFESGFAAIMSTTSGQLVMLSGAVFLATWFLTPGHRFGDLGDRSTGFALASAIGALYFASVAMANATETNSTIAREATSAVAAYVITISLFMGPDRMEGAIEDAH